MDYFFKLCMQQQTFIVVMVPVTLSLVGITAIFI